MKGVLPNMPEMIAQPPFSGGSAPGRAWIELDREALRHNVTALRAMLPAGCRLMPAVKANAYGHGAALVVPELQAMGVDAFCVATAEEGAELRQKGVTGLMLILGYTPPEHFPLLARWALTQTVVDADYARLLNALGGCGVHIGIDTGMHRLGIDCNDIESVCEVLGLENLRVEGVFTHLCSADGATEADADFTQAQGRAFRDLCGSLEGRGLRFGHKHILNSSGLLRYPELGGELARVGIALYGVMSTLQETLSHRAVLRPVLSLKARVASVKTLRAGEGAGYGLAFTARRETRLAVLSIGYADGLPRSLSCGMGSVLIRSVKAPIVGRICMDQTLVDVTSVPGAAAGDTAVLIGTSGSESIGVCELAHQSGTISNEILSRLGPRLKRIWTGD